MLRPLNDLCKVNVSPPTHQLVAKNKDTAENGILVSLPNKFLYFGFWSFAFEDSFMNRTELDNLYKEYEKLIGQRVYWTALSEKGSLIQEGDEAFAYIKLTSLIAADVDTENVARNLHGDGAGAFNI